MMREFARERSQARGEPGRLRDRLLAFCVELADTAELVAKATLRAPGELLLDRELPASVVTSSSALILTRVREVASCALDEIERQGKMTNEQIGDGIGRHRTLVARIVRTGDGAVAYLMRPVGAVVFGHVGDRQGRRPMLLLSMAVMSAAMLATS